MTIARSGRTTNPILQDAQLARVINSYCGSSIAPWDVGQLPEEYIDTFLGLAQVPTMQAGINKIEAAKSKFRNALRN